MIVREAQSQDLEQLLTLYTHLHDNSMPQIGEKITKLWQKIIELPDHHIVVGTIDDEIISSCVVVIVPNLTHDQRPYALIENVITHPEHRGKGNALDVLEYARNLATVCNCYKIMLMTSSKEDRTLELYRKAGYNMNDKTAFVQWLE